MLTCGHTLKKRWNTKYEELTSSWYCTLQFCSLGCEMIWPLQNESGQKNTNRIIHYEIYRHPKKLWKLQCQHSIAWICGQSRFLSGHICSFGRIFAFAEWLMTDIGQKLTKENEERKSVKLIIHLSRSRTSKQSAMVEEKMDGWELDWLQAQNLTQRWTLGSRLTSQNWKKFLPHETDIGMTGWEVTTGRKFR